MSSSHLISTASPSWRVNRRQAAVRCLAAMRSQVTHSHRNRTNRRTMDRLHRTNGPQASTRILIVRQLQPPAQVQAPIELRSPIQLQLPTQTWPNDQPFRFLDLPQEIQIQIARLIAVVPGRLQPLREPDWNYKLYPGATGITSFLQFNREIYNTLKKDYFEAFYRQNLFHLTVRRYILPMIGKIPHLTCIKHLNLHLWEHKHNSRFGFMLYEVLQGVVRHFPKLQTVTLQFQCDEGYFNVSHLCDTDPQNLTPALFTLGMSQLLLRVKNRITIIAPAVPSQFVGLKLAVAPSVQFLAEGQGERDGWEDFTPRARDRAVAALKTFRYHPSTLVRRPELPVEETEELRAWIIRPGQLLLVED